MLRGHFVADARCSFRPQKCSGGLLRKGKRGDIGRGLDSKAVNHLNSGFGAIHFGITPPSGPQPLYRPAETYAKMLNSRD